MNEHIYLHPSNGEVQDGHVSELEVLRSNPPESKFYQFRKCCAVTAIRQAYLLFYNQARPELLIIYDWNIMEFKTMLRLQKCLYFNFYLFVTWFFVTGFFLYDRVNTLGHLTKYLSLTVYTLLIIIESPRIYLGIYGNLSRRVPELSGFLMLTVLMQLPLVSFFLFNPFLLSTPMELTLHAMLWFFTITEVVVSFIALKQASNYAKSIYLSQTKNR